MLHHAIHDRQFNFPLSEKQIFELNLNEHGESKS